MVFDAGGPLPAEPVGLPYVDARVALVRALKEGRSTATLLGPAGPYMQNLAAPWSAPLVSDDVIAHPLPAELPLPGSRSPISRSTWPRRSAARATSAADEQAWLLDWPRGRRALSVALAWPVRWEDDRAGRVRGDDPPVLGDHAAQGLGPVAPAQWPRDCRLPNPSRLTCAAGAPVSGPGRARRSGTRPGCSP